MEEDFEAYKLKKQFDPEKAKLLKDEGAVLIKNGKYLEAVEKYTEAIGHLPTQMLTPDAKTLDLQIHNNRSIALFKAGQIHAAYEDCEFVLK